MKKPWNRVSLPVYSISSTDKQGNSNMNIITYAQAVSMQPKQFICAIYYNTKTLQNVAQNPHFVLQILQDTQFKLVNVLGKKTGHSYNKINYLHKKDLITTWNGFTVLKDAIALLEMKAIPLTNQEDKSLDHRIFLCEVINYKNQQPGNALTTTILSQHKIIRI